MIGKARSLPPTSARRRLSLAGAGLLAAALALALSAPAAWAAHVPEEGVRASAQPAATWTGFYPSDWSNQLPLESGVTATDAAGLNPATAAYRTSTNGGASWTGWLTANLTATPLDSTTVALQVTGLNFPNSDTQNQLQYRIETTGGAEQVSDSYVVKVDTIAPGSPFGLQSSPDHWTNVNAFAETWINPSDLSGIAGAYYLLNREPTSATDGVYVATTNSISGIQVPSQGTHALYLWLVDGAGNVDHRTRNVDPDAFRYDATAPTIGVSKSGPVGQDGWYLGAVTVNFNPQDTLSGVADWGWLLDGAASGNSLSTVVAGDLVHTLVVTATDAAGNSAEPVITTIPIDATPPDLAYTIDAASEPGPSGWYTAPLTVTLALSDAMSGPDVVTYQLDGQPAANGTEVTLQQDGDHRLTAYGTDVAGNRSSQLSLSLPLDSTPPTTSALVTPTVAASGWYTAAVTGKLQAIDTASGVATTWLRIDDGAWQATKTFALPDNGIYHLDFYSVDVATNVEITRSLAISLDRIAPGQPSLAFVEPSGWTANNSFALYWDNPVETSGVAGAYVYIGQGPPVAHQARYFPQPDPWAPSGLITGLLAPAEGEWPVWIWLRDVAGNANPASALQVGFLRFDATPPELTATVAGTTGSNGWYTGPIDVTLTLRDAGSGPGLLHYRLNGSPWQETSAATAAVQITAPGKHVLEYYGEDIAGAVSGPYLRTLRLDPVPPPPPLALTVEPDTWTPTNQFTITWRNPLDTSGVITAYVSLDAPSGPRDGQAIPASSLTHSLTVPSEGVHDLYVWLEDAAGNVDQTQASHLTGALRYDATPPQTTVLFMPEPSPSGWFRSGVSVRFATSDDHSGVASTVWQLDELPPSSASWLFVEGDGVHRLVVSSTDHASNVEQPTEHLIRIDTQAPTAWLDSLGTYSANPQIRLSWQGDDAPPATTQSAESINSGIAGYNVQVRRGATGAWEPWLNNTMDTTATYEGRRGQGVAFRVQAMDLAGNLSPWSEANGRNRVFVDPIQNGVFSTNNFDGWETHLDLGMNIVLDDDLTPDATISVGRLGWQGWEGCAVDGNLPTPLCSDSWSGIAQTIQIPPAEELPNPTLNLWYRIQSYDVISTTYSTIIDICDPQASFLWADTFDVTVKPAGAATATVLLRDGNRIRPDFGQPNPPIPLRDLGWQHATFDMSAFAGQTVQVELATHNRLDARFNTWTDVYRVQLSGAPTKVFLPLITSAASAHPDELTYCYPLGQPSQSLMTPAAPPPLGQEKPSR